MVDMWPTPLPFIESRGDCLVIVEETAALLTDINFPLVVVVIAGIYRTGKSYLMNRLAGKKTGFPLGNTLQSKTKGIWIWCLPHPQRSDCAFLLLDTEGLCDPEKGSEKNDMEILTLSVLLSSFFAYNAIGRIDNHMINKLHFVAEIIDNIATKVEDRELDCDPDYEELREYLPDFALVVRDFALDLEINQQVVTSDEYFDKILQPKPGNDRYNRPRDAIRRAFRSHSCFVLPRPVSDETLFCRLETLEEQELSFLFAKQSTDFCNFVFDHAVPKKIKVHDGQVISGIVWLALAREYVRVINNEAVPCIESTIAIVAERTIMETMEHCMRIYKLETDGLALPLLTKEVKDSHRIARKMAICYYYKNCVFDEERNYLTALKIKLGEARHELKTKNKQCSQAQCRNLLESIYGSLIGPKMADGSYICINGYNGYNMYKADIRDMTKQYDSNAFNNGCMHATVLHQFLAEKITERQGIKKSVKELKKLLEMQRRTEEVERKERLEREEIELLTQHLEHPFLENEEEIRRETAEREMEERRRQQAERRRMDEEMEEARKRREKEIDELRATLERWQSPSSGDRRNCTIM